MIALSLRGVFVNYNVSVYGLFCSCVLCVLLKGVYMIVCCIVCNVVCCVLCACSCLCLCICGNACACLFEMLCDVVCCVYATVASCAYVCLSCDCVFCLCLVVRYCMMCVYVFDVWVRVVNLFVCVVCDVLRDGVRFAFFSVDVLVCLCARLLSCVCVACS